MYLTKVGVKFCERNTRYPEGSWNFGPQNSNIKQYFQRVIQEEAKPHFYKLSAATIALHRIHSLRAFPDFRNQGKPQDHLLHTNKQNIITSFRLGDAGLGSRSMNRIKVCPVCKIGNNTEAHLVFQCTAVHHLRGNWKFSIASQTDDTNPFYRSFSM